MKIFIDGIYYDQAEASVSVFDHGLLYGDGVFEGIRIYNGKVFRLREHVERLYQSAAAISLQVPMATAEMEAAIMDAVKVNSRENGYIRLIVTRGKGPLGIDPLTCGRATVIIIVSDIRLYPEEYYRDGIEIMIASTRRIPPECLDPRIKSLNYLNNILAKLEARNSGCFEAVMLNTQGFVAECTADNIFVVKEGALLTPSPHHGALQGITRDTVMEAARSAGIEAIESALAPYDLYTADECFLTGTGAEIVPVIKIDGRTIGNGRPGPVTRRLIEAFRESIA